MQALTGGIHWYTVVRLTVKANPLCTVLDQLLVPVHAFIKVLLCNQRIKQKCFAVNALLSRQFTAKANGRVDEQVKILTAASMVRDANAQTKTAIQAGAGWNCNSAFLKAVQ